MSIEGSNGSYVTSFLVHSSNDNIKWMVFKDKTSGKPKVIVTIVLHTVLLVFFNNFGTVSYLNYLRFVWYLKFVQYKITCFKLSVNFVPSALHTLEYLQTVRFKTKLITLANHRGHRKSTEPIKIRGNYMLLAQSAGKRMHWLWFYFWLDERVMRLF